MHLATQDPVDASMRLADWVVVDDNDNRVHCAWPCVELARDAFFAWLSQNPEMVGDVSVVRVGAGEVQDVDWPRPESPFQRARQLHTWLNAERSPSADNLALACDSAREFYLFADRPQHRLEIVQLWWLTDAGDELPVGQLQQTSDGGLRLLLDDHEHALSRDDVVSRLAGALSRAGVSADYLRDRAQGADSNPTPLVEAATTLALDIAAVLGQLSPWDPMCNG
jgi:hypothetical protein